MKTTTVALLFAIFAQSQVEAAAPETMRIDFYHTGNHEMEIFSLDQVVVEPLPWTGNMNYPIDETLRGKYLFEIVDPDSGNCRMVTKLQQHLWRVGNNIRGTTDESHLP